MSARRVRKPVGSRWRTLAWTPEGERIEQRSDGESVFDEMVIDRWLHLAQMGDREWWAQIGDAYIWIHIPSRGTARVTCMMRNNGGGMRDAC